MGGGGRLEPAPKQGSTGCPIKQAGGGCRWEAHCATHEANGEKRGTPSDAEKGALTDGAKKEEPPSKPASIGGHKQEHAAGCKGAA